MTMDARTLATTYFQSRKERDFITLRSILADDVTFHGTLGTTDGAEKCVEGMTGLAKIITDIVIRKMVADGPDVMTWYDLHMRVAPPCPTVNSSHIEDGKITAIRAVFDPRDIIQGIGQ
jgi:hypothetical protein